MSWHFERCLCLPVLAGEQDIHHSRPSAARKKSFHRWRHDFCLGLTRLVSFHQRPKTIEDDVHSIADFGEFLSALHRARHVELKIKWHEFERGLLKLAV